MVATMHVFYDNSTGPSVAEATGSPVDLRFKTADDNTPDTNNPIPIVAANIKYSYWKHLYLKCSVAPDTQIDNVKVYRGGSSPGWTGVVLYTGDENPVNLISDAAGYQQASGTAGDTGFPATGIGGHSDITTWTDFDTFTSGAARTVTIGGDNLIQASGETTNYVVFQMTVDGDVASPGDLADMTITWQYDEI